MDYTVKFQTMFTSEEEAKKAVERLLVDNKELERIEALLASFNIFEAIGMRREEIRHSYFLAFLLNPGETHRLEDVFLKRLLKRVLIGANNPPISPIEIDVANLKNAEVRREWENIDILVCSQSSRMVFAIENKIGSGEHSDQLNRYRKIVSEEFSNYRSVLIYLTPDGDLPSHDAWISYSYSGVVELIDDICQSYRSTINSDVYTLMQHYSRLLRRHVVSDSEMAELCRKVYNQHKQALDLIYEHRPDLQSALAEFLRERITNAASDLVLNDRSKVFIRFAPKEWDHLPFQSTAQGWTRTRRVLLFEFVNRPNELFLWLLLGPGNDEIARQSLYQIAVNNKSVFSEIGPKGPGWTCLFKKQIFDANDYQDPDVQDLKPRIDAVWQDFLLQDLPKIRKLISEQASAATEANIEP